MKLLPNLALALMLSMGATAMVTTPAVAGKKEDKAAAPKAELSTEFKAAAVPVETALKAKDYATALAKLPAAEAIAKSDDERYYVAVYHLQIGSGKNDSVELAKALDLLLPNPKTPAGDLPKYYNARGGIAADANQYAAAIPFLQKARDLGYTGVELQINFAKAYGGTGKTAEAIAELGKGIDMETAAGHTVPDAWYSFVVTNSFAIRDLTGGEKWLVRQLTAYPKLATWRTAVNNYHKIADPSATRFTKAQKLDLMRMMIGTNALTDANDYFVYATAAQDSGLPWEAVSSIDSGRAAGRLPSSDAGIGRLYTAATIGARTEGSAASAASKSKPAIAADIYLSNGDNAQAASLYATALGQPGADANTLNYRLGVALARLGRKDEAKAAFAKVTAAPLVDISHLWVLWLDLPPLT